jgi:hypothetical protein
MVQLIIGFIKGYWKVILPVILIGSFIFWVNHLIGERDDAVKQLAEYKQQQMVLVEKQKAEIAIKDKQAEVDLMEAQKVHDAEMKAYNLDRDKVTAKLKELYDAKIYRLNHANDSMLPEPYSCALSMSNTPQDSSRPTSNGQDEYTTALEQACRLTTLDYNKLRAWADTACNQVTCE